MSNAQNIYQKCFGYIGTKIDKINPQFGREGGEINTYSDSYDFYVAGSEI